MMHHQVFNHLYSRINMTCYELFDFGSWLMDCTTINFIRSKEQFKFNITTEFNSLSLYFFVQCSYKITTGLPRFLVKLYGSGTLMTVIVSTKSIFIYIICQFSNRTKSSCTINVPNIFCRNYLPSLSMQQISISRLM